MLKWSEALNVGVTEIDDQHKELFARINSLLDASRQGKGKDEVIRIIQFLESYVVTHFVDEEALMSRHGYPDLAAHRQLHQAFIADVAAIRRDFEEKGTSAVLVIQVQQRVVGWLKDHIGGKDKEVGAHIQAKAKLKG